LRKAGFHLTLVGTIEDRRRMKAEDPTIGLKIILPDGTLIPAKDYKEEV
jgi:hypothetical protein